MNCFEYLLSLNEVCHFQTIEGQKYGPCSKSELRRWLKNSVLHINGKAVKDTDPLPRPIYEVVLFPKNRNKRCILYYETPAERDMP